MKSMMTAAVCGVLMMTAGGADAAELVTNGGFETNDFTGWTPEGNKVSVFVAEKLGSQAPHGGLYQAALGSREVGGALSQTLDTVANQTYAVTFSLANLELGLNSSFEASFGGVPLLTLLAPPATSYRTFNLTGIATGSRTALTFSFRNDPSFFLLDDVSVQGMTSAVPEPATWALMLLGFGGIAGAARRRSRRAVPA